MASRTVLFVDDEQSILSSIRRLLHKEDYDKLFAVSGKQALALLEEHDVHLIVSDQRMPDMVGTKFLATANELYPDTVRVILSGYAEVCDISDAINKGHIYRLFGKPWNDEELKMLIKECLEHYEILAKNRELQQQTSFQNDELSRLNAELVALNRSLEQKVEERTKSLQLSQEVLEKLPIAVIGVSSEGHLVLSNEYARFSIPGLMLEVPGSEIAGFLPDELNQAVSSVLNATSHANSLSIVWDVHKYAVHVQPLLDVSSIRGCILMLRREGDPQSNEALDR